MQLLIEDQLLKTESQGLKFRSCGFVRTHTSFECYGGEIIGLNFQKNKNRLTAQAEVLSNQTEFQKFQLPLYYSKNRSLFNSCFNICKKKKTDLVSNKIENNFNLIAEKFSELEFKDMHLEMTNQGVIKATLLFDDNKFLIVSKDEDDDSDDIIYSYFIDRKLIDADVTEIREFVQRFKEYRNL